MSRLVATSPPPTHDAHVLVVDDDPHIREVVRFALERAGHRVSEAPDGRSALHQFAAEAVDVVVLDVLMPEIDGLEVCRSLRRESEVPILLLSSRDEEIDRVLGLELGADDYVCKPFSPRELVARVRCLLRRVRMPAAAESPPPPPLHNGALVLDVERHRCVWADREVDLTATEFGLLRSLCGRPGKVYSRDELVERTWGSGHHITDRTVDSHIRRIRRKFGALGADPVETVYGVGYRLRENAGS